MSLLNSKIAYIDDPETTSLMEELSAVTGIDYQVRQNSMLLHFLQQCWFPNGALSKPVKISKYDLDEYDPHDEYLLRKKIGKLNDPLFRTFEQLVNQSRHCQCGIEHFTGTKIYVFLNQMLVPVKKKVSVRLYR